MALFVDASALVRRYARDRHHRLVVDTMAADPDWCASALCRTETQIALHRLAVSPRQQSQLWRELRDDWEAFAVVPVDERCLARAAEIGAEFGLPAVDAVHLAAADRLPRPLRFVTFDRRQLPGALALGMEVVSPLADA